MECAYADKLEVEMQELGVKLTEAMETIQQTKAQVRFSYIPLSVLFVQVY